MLIYLIDTNAWIHATKHPEGTVARRLFPAADRRELVVSVFVRAELMEGAYACRNPEADLRLLTAMLNAYPELPFDEQTVDRYARTRALLSKAGTPIGPIDTAIAATALVHGCTVVTHNRQHFDRVPELAVEDWEQEDLA